MQDINSFWQLGRFDRPVGIWLLLLPCWWGLVLGAESLPQIVGGFPFVLQAWAENHNSPGDLLIALKMTDNLFGLLPLFALFGVGAMVMRAAGCVINDILDRNIDKSVARTAGRPLASGAVSVHHAILFLIALVACGAVVWWQLPVLAKIIAFAAMLPAALYPLAKRVTWWPQAVLGMTFNLGVLIGFTTLQHPVTAQAWLLYLAGFFWTIAYDTIYAHQDVVDDAIIGVKSTARLFGRHSKTIIAILYLLMLLCLGMSVSSVTLAGWGMFAVLTVWLFYGLVRWQPDSPASCLSRFRDHVQTGWFVLWFLLLGRFVYV